MYVNMIKFFQDIKKAIFLMRFMSGIFNYMIVLEFKIISQYWRDVYI